MRPRYILLWFYTQCLTYCSDVFGILSESWLTSIYKKMYENWVYPHIHPTCLISSYFMLVVVARLRPQKISTISRKPRWKVEKYSGCGLSCFFLGLFSKELRPLQILEALLPSEWCHGARWYQPRCETHQGTRSDLGAPKRALAVGKPSIGHGING